MKRRKKIQNYLKSYSTLKLQIGCGRNILPDWLNTDRDIALSKETVFLDASKRFPFYDSTFSYIYSEHFIEHLEYYKGVHFIQECYRVIRPGGKIRIATPDLNFLVDLYAKNKTELQEKYIEWAVKTHSNFNISTDTFVINNYFRAWGHKFIYDFKTLKLTLIQLGFINIKRCKVGESDDKHFANLESHGREIGDEFNRLETIIVEATKP
jgi:predicted SAM-dependent methyltransferase